MKKYLLLFVVALTVMSVAAFAARSASTYTPYAHDVLPVFQAYPGDSNGTNTEFLGYNGAGNDVITAVPGVLSIVPGTNWANYVKAAQDGVPYFIKNVVLTKTIPFPQQCQDWFTSAYQYLGLKQKVVQQGTPNIRTWWPLLYELPGVEWKLWISYGTYSAYNPFPGFPAENPNQAGSAHQEEWYWKVDVTFDSISDALAVFHTLPFGLCEVPIISDEVCYVTLQDLIADAAAAYNAGDTVAASQALMAFDSIVNNSCITVCPPNSKVTGAGTGIANTYENPACCKLAADAEYLGFALNIFQPAK